MQRTFVGEHGFLFLYKKFEAGRLLWPRNIQRAAELTEDQFHYLMMGLNPLDSKIKDVDLKNLLKYLCKTEKIYRCFSA